MSEERRLIGEDGSLFRGTLGTEVVGNGTLTITAKTLVYITSDLAANAGSAFEGLDTGYFYYSPILTAGADLPAGAKWKVMSQANSLDLAGWSLEANGDVIETTVLADKFKKKRRGKLDATGNATISFIKGITDIAATGFMNSFYDIVTISNTGVATLSPVSSEPFWVVGWLDDKDSVSGNHKLFTVFQAEFDNWPINVKMGEAQGFDTTFHLAGATDPVLYRVQNV